MKKLGLFCILSVVALLILAPQGWVLAQEEESSLEGLSLPADIGLPPWPDLSGDSAVELPSKEDLVEPAVEGCKVLISSGSGGKYWQICISPTGNVNILYPPGVRNMYREGYNVCASSAVAGYSYGAYEYGCGTPTYSQPGGYNTLPLTITRMCQCVQFKQVFTKDNAEKDLAINMTYTNKCGYILPYPIIVRLFDADVNSSASNDRWDTSAFGIWARDVDALTYTDLSFPTTFGIRSWVQTSAQQLGSYNTCSSFPVVYTPYAGDGAGRFLHVLGTSIAPGASKTVKGVYRLQ